MGQSDLKQQNTAALLSILLHNDYVSRRMLINKSGLAASTVSMITGNLLSENIIREAGSMAANGSGRRTQLLTRNPKASYAASVFITPEKVSIGLFDFSYKLVDSQDFIFDGSFSEAYSMSLVNGLKNLIGKHNIHRKLKAIGLALPSNPYDVDIILESFQKNFKEPVILINNVEAIALSEYYHSLHKEYQTLAYVYVGTGIGSAIVINGELYKGANGRASDFGHMHVLSDSSVCRCGRTGCLETKAAEWAIKEKLQALPECEFSKADSDTDTVISTLMGEINKKTPAAVQILQDAAYYLGVTIYNFVSVVDPEVVYISGRICQLNPLFSSLVEQSYMELAQYSPKHIVPLRFIPLRENSGMDGAAIYSFMYTYTKESLI